jgi:hypothetical protein
MSVLLLILKTIGDFFLDSKGDGDPMRSLGVLAFAFFVVMLFQRQVWWEPAGCAVISLSFFVLSIWHDRRPGKKTPPDPTQGVPRS